ncbi:MAG: GspH/FimT family pseudopilin [Clostridiales bacterium]|nr:GspH/FimT family pseudopilin [Clostridiales bacterium]
MKKGLSLLEALIILAVASLMIFAASTPLLTSSPKYRLKKAAGEIYARLNYARYRAIFDGQAVRVSFSSTSYTIEKYDSPLKKWTPVASGAPEGVRIEANNSPIFHPVGTVSNLATIVVSNSWGKYKLTLAISGRIRMVML